MANLREKGKVPRAEWPIIVERYRRGESLARIARDYHCTAPAIRYIVKRDSVSATTMVASNGDELERSDAALRGSIQGAESPASSESHVTQRARRVPLTSRFSFDAKLRERISNDIALFLSALDVALSGTDRAALENLRDATDRLMRAAARTRIELERALNEEFAQK